MKTIIFLALAAGAAMTLTGESATIISTTVTQTGGVFHYSYVVPKKIQGVDVLGVTIPLCDGKAIFDQYGIGNVTMSGDSIRFAPNGEDVTFGFSSLLRPDTGKAFIETAKEDYTATIRRPSCVAPEPSVFLLVFGGLILFNRRR